MPRKPKTGLTEQQEVMPSSTFSLDVSSVTTPLPVIAPIQQATQKAAQNLYTNALVEEVKQMELMNQLCTYVTTLRLNKTNDATIVDELNSLFSFTGKKIKQAEWKKVLCAYSDIRRAYIRGSLDQIAALSAFMSDYLLDYFGTHGNDAKNALTWQKQLDDKLLKQEELRAGATQAADALKVSETTRSTLATIAQSLIAAPQPDFDSPADEEIEWDSKKDGDD